MPTARRKADGVVWRVTGEDSDAFWLHRAAFEAQFSMEASRSAQSLDSSAVAAIVDATTPLPCQEWTWLQRARLASRPRS